MWKSYDYIHLTAQHLYDIFKLRQDVFIIEQQCIYPDIDGKDTKALHLMGYDAEQLVAYARLFAPNDYFADHCSFGRLATAQSARGKGIGKELVIRCIELCKQHWPNSTIEISGQYYLLDFYRNLGFKPVGDIYLEDDIEHMRFLLS